MLIDLILLGLFASYLLIAPYVLLLFILYFFMYSIYLNKQKRHKQRKKIVKPVRDRFQAKLSFFLSLGFWVPLFNIGLTLVSIILAIRALRLCYTHPEKFGGVGYAIIALIISLSGFIGTIIFISIYVYRKVTCEVVPTIL